MATIHFAKIGPRKIVEAGATKTCKWNNPPWGTVLSYWAVPVPDHPHDPDPKSTGQVEVTRVRVTRVTNLHSDDKQFVEVDVHNSGTSRTGFDLYQSWIT